MRVQLRGAWLYVLGFCLGFWGVSVLATGSGLGAQMAGAGPGCVSMPGPIGTMSCGDGMTTPNTSRAKPAERAAYDAFAAQDDVETKIHLGEDFDRKYPNSIYENSVDTALTSLYYNRQDWPKFYAMGEKTIAKNPKNLAIMELVGWAIPRNSSFDPAAAAKLDEAENYEKRAIELLGAMKKPKEFTQEDFDASLAGLGWRAHSGLGLTYLRKKEYAESATELQIAVKDEGVDVDAGDLYALGIALENLNRKSEAVEIFTKCGQISGDIQDACQQALQKATAELNASPDETDYEAFSRAANPDTQIALGEKFDQAHPSSPYEERVLTTLAGLYASKQDWVKFHATSAKALAKNADNAPVLALTGWALSHNYDANDPGAAGRLDEAEKDEKHALDLISAMQRPADLTQEQFDRAKSGEAQQAHSGLGVSYFRRGDFADSAQELQLATADSSRADAFDLYVLGVDQEKLGRTVQALDAFSRCAAIAGGMQAQCKSDVDALVMKSTPAAANLSTQSQPNAPAELATVAAKPSSSSARSSSADIPRSAETEPTIKAETVLVPVRVVVRDTKGMAVADLKQEEFKLYQDGKQVEISSFTAINNASLSHAAPVTAPGAAGIGNGAPGGNAAAVAATAPAQFVALFFDDVHLYFSDMAQVRSAAEKYLATLHPEDRVAIVTASGEGELDFTSDRDELEKAMAEVKPRPFPGGTMAPVTGGEGGKSGDCPAPMTYTEADAIVRHNSQGVLDAAGSDFYGCVYGIKLASAEAAAAIGKSLATEAAGRTQAAGEQATDAIFDRLAKTVRRLSTAPGQRIVVMVSPGFVYSGHQADFAEIINLALRYKVVINTLDAKGINGCMYRDPRGCEGGADGKWNPDRFEQFGFGHSEVEQPVLEDLADGTGGLFVKNNNDFAGTLREFGETPEAYYLIAYAPRNLPNDGKYHALKVNLARRANYTVQARRGFYAPSNAETPEEAAKREMDDALFSDEQQHDLPVKLETQVTRDASGAQKLAVKADVDASQLRFNKAGSTNQEEVTVDAALFDADGNYVTGTQKVDDMNLSDATLAQIEKSGVYLEFDFDVKPGDYTVRLVARDANDRHLAAESETVSVTN